MIGIINYGMGNLASVKNALDYLNLPNMIVNQPSDIETCDKYILPGVGAFGEAMLKITNNSYSDKLKEYVLMRKRPILGICLGMQLLLESSVEFGFNEGLSFVKGSVSSFGDKIKDLPIPHVGWNSVLSPPNSRLMKGVDENEKNFYFVHSYYCDLEEEKIIKGQTYYGFMFDAMFEKENIYGVQFHPEKSQKSGLTLLKNFGDII